MEQKHLGKVRVQPGQSLFALDMKTGAITDMGKPRRVDVQPMTIYRVALNRKSFIKKLIHEGILEATASSKPPTEKHPTSKGNAVRPRTSLTLNKKKGK